ncbi:MAG: hypothetical protein LUI87_08210 [Lachnospiraceae bacterium]|nr:hypothetical protein [Lachnospiraceae bacterium]
MAARKLWTEEELAILTEGYPKEGLQVMERLPGRTKSMITQQAYRMGLAPPQMTGVRQNWQF